MKKQKEGDGGENPSDGGPKTDAFGRLLPPPAAVSGDTLLVETTTANGSEGTANGEEGTVNEKGGGVSQES